MSVTKKLILVATLPAILACSFVMFAAITDMHKQRDHLVEYTATLIEANNSNPLSTSDAQNRVKQAWTEKYDELATVAIPSLILVLVALVATALFFVTRITKGLNHLVEGVKILSSPETPLSYRVSIDEAQDLEPIVLNVNGMMGRIEQAFLQVKDISLTIDEASKLLADNADSNQQNSENLLANMESVSTAMVELQSASQEISNNVQSAYKEVSDINNQGQDLTREVNSLNELLNHQNRSLNRVQMMLMN